MSAPTNHWKLGLFVVFAMLVGLAGLAYFGSRNLPKDTVLYTSYFDEAVTGLEVGSPVKYRGVNVGNVAKIEVAPDRRHVQVGYEMASEAAKRLALDKASTENSRLGSALRAQLGSMGVTGVKYVSLDLFEDSETPEPLSFEPARHYIPTQPSTLRNLESAVNNTAHKLPEVTEQVVVLLNRLNTLIGSVQEEQLPQRAGKTLERVEQTLTLMNSRLEQLKIGELSSEAKTTFHQLQDTIAHFDRLLARVDGQSGVLANAERASSNMGDVARNASHVGTEAERTLREISEAASAVRELADAIERQPDMLLKGRARSQP
ncbi:MAG TPA: MlaD family protein [Polyangiales bacterium]|nr:MlaD family protein [Polyangiales bacterium]